MNWRNVAWFEFLLWQLDSRIRKHGSILLYNHGTGTFFSRSTSWASFQHPSVLEYCCWPCANPLCPHCLYVPCSDSCFQQDNTQRDKPRVTAHWCLKDESEWIFWSMAPKQTTRRLYQRPTWELKLNLERSKCWRFKCLQQPYDGVMSYRVGFHSFLTPAVMSATNCSVVVSFPSVVFDLRVPHWNVHTAHT